MSSIDLEALLGGAGAGGGDPMGAPPMDPGMGPMGPMAPPPPAAPEPPGDTVDVIKQMVDLAKNYLEVEDDDVEKQQMTKILALLQDYLAREQKELDDAMGGKMSGRLMRKTYGA